VPAPIAGQQAFVLTGSAAWSGPSWLEATVAAAQTTALGTGDHVVFASVLSSGGDVALDTSSTYSTAVGSASIGRFTVLAGRCYRLFASPGQVASPGDSATPTTFAWWDATANAQIGLAQSLSLTTAPAGVVMAPVVQAFYRPATASLVELRITSNAIVTQLGGVGVAAPYASVEVVR